MPKRKNGAPLGATAKRSRTGPGRNRRAGNDDAESESSRSRPCKSSRSRIENTSPGEAQEATPPEEGDQTRAEDFLERDELEVEEKKEEKAVIALPECPVCFTPVGENGRAVAPCGHIFCVKCFVRWMRMRSTCPFCRRSVVEEEPVEADPAVIILMVNDHRREQERLAAVAQNPEENEQEGFWTPFNFGREGYDWTLDLAIIFTLVGMLWVTVGMLLPRNYLSLLTIRFIYNLLAAVIVMSVFHKRMLHEEEQQQRPPQAIGRHVFRLPRNIRP
uniref:RING-type domain-containing protein n=1 Tax=Lotharella oceanica TaxID=641309 RepID=A0A7S2TMH2_9EUKA|mmetsp:Transcript_21025/g.39460  ORF Transcript_21025/g.39460 Transcript_21025/m.39460 type:complete len:275 (+) Transcript_21025:58-882(+)